MHSRGAFFACNVLVAGGLAFFVLARSASAATMFVQTNLTSDIKGLAANMDGNLKNPWGMSFSPTSPFWVSDQMTNVATLYNGAGVPQSLVVALVLVGVGRGELAHGPVEPVAAAQVRGDDANQPAGRTPGPGRCRR